jgi:4-amino-4-deoxy-L-arabinose transferase-like glycosyltransferase
MKYGTAGNQGPQHLENWITMFKLRISHTADHKSAAWIQCITDKRVVKLRFLITAKHWPLLFLLAVCFFLFFWELGSIPFYTRGEPREGLVVWEMYKTSNWVLPIINGDYIPFKPPLFHWLATLVAITVGRVDEFVLRFPSALFATLGVLATYYFGGRLWNRRAGLIAAVVLSTTFDWWQTATITQVDMILAFFISSTLMLFYFVYQEAHLRTARSLLLAVSLGLGTLAKGPVGVVVPLFVIFVFLGVRRDLGFLKKLPLFRGVAIFLLVAGSWYGLAFLQGGAEFFQRQIVNETLLTEVGSYGHHQPVYYFLPTLFYNMLPWSFFFPGLVVFLFRKHRCLSEEHILYPLVWAVAVFVFFSVALGKRGVYILPLYPAGALLFGAWWSAMEEGKEGGELTRWVGLFYAISGVIALVVIAIYVASEFGIASGSFLSKKFGNLAPVMSAFAGASFAVGSLVLLAGCLFLLVWFLLKERWRGVFGCLTVIALVQAVVMKDAYLPYVASERTMKPFMSRVTERVDSSSPLLFYRAFDYGTLFYAHRHIPSYAARFAELRRPYFLLMWEEDLEPLSEANRLKVLDTSEGRGPAGRHRLVLVEPQQDSPIADPKGYGTSKADYDDSGRD